jgi:hypothetical protein
MCNICDMSRINVLTHLYCGSSQVRSGQVRSGQINYITYMYTAQLVHVVNNSSAALFFAFVSPEIALEAF